jgi:hypothetical protein
MKSTFQILVFSIISVVLYATFVQGCNKSSNEKPKIVYLDGKPYEVLKKEIDTQYLKQEIKWNRDTLLVDTTIFIPVPTIVDTLAILKQYFAKNIYTDTLHLGDAGFVFVRDTISKNTIDGRFYHAIINQKTITETTIVKEPNKANIYFGFSSGVNKSGINNIGADFILKSKKDIMYGLGLGADINKNTFVNASIHWKIK